ncbi:DNA-binding IclR family transcriptional regulator [Neobacillus niacini]|uniref:IclR family transcriptional regulator n=1 Tax=Neobacillus niacini TaxID=86668 RepID=UPI002859A4DF|nr:IclR family transcriptional regulator C-terminal domain-containing protein [Neobacillus niacini]MDR7077446.1 DNA-binding IclR family transcriptional regulator [Neobacillus niacini]
MEDIKKGTTIQSLQIGMGIIESIAKQRKPLKFTEIQDLTQITKSNLYKYLNTFTQLGILYRSKETGEYVLGSKLIEYGMSAVDQENVTDRISPFLHEINEKSSSTVLFSRWTQNGPMIVKDINTNRGLNIGAQIGTILPINSASGKVFMAFMDEQIIHDWKKNEFKKSPNESVSQLEDECKIIQEKGIAFAREPLVSSVSSVSFPVFNYQKKLLGTVTVVGFSEIIPENENHDLSHYFIQISKEISGCFGYKT